MPVSHERHQMDAMAREINTIQVLLREAALNAKNHSPCPQYLWAVPAYTNSP